MAEQALRPLTDRQREVLSWIYHLREANGVAPSFRELGKKLGIRSTNGISDHLVALENKGMLIRQEGGHRTLRVTELGLHELGVASQSLLIEQLKDRVRWLESERDRLLRLLAAHGIEV